MSPLKNIPCDETFRTPIPNLKLWIILTGTEHSNIKPHTNGLTQYGFHYRAMCKSNQPVY